MTSLVFVTKRTGEFIVATSMYLDYPIMFMEFDEEDYCLVSGDFLDLTEDTEYVGEL